MKQRRSKQYIKYFDAPILLAVNLILIFCWLAEKSGLGGCDIEERREFGRCSSFSVLSEAEYFFSSLSEYITTSRICFGDSRRARELLRSIVENCSATSGWNSKLSPDKAVGENAADRYLTTTTTTT